METNPYAPPVAPLLEPAPSKVALWNPGAAASWSLLFTPAFGAYLHMRNWQALGNKAKADAQRVWMIGAIIGTIAFQAIAVSLPSGDIVSRAGGLGLLFGWYFSSGKHQADLVKERFGTAYEHRGWGKPIAVAFGILFGLALLFFGALFTVMGFSH